MKLHTYEHSCVLSNVVGEKDVGNQCTYIPPGTDKTERALLSQLA